MAAASATDAVPAGKEAPELSVQSLPITLQGSRATLSFDQSLFWLTKSGGSSSSSSSKAIINGEREELFWYLRFIV